MRILHTIGNDSLWKREKTLFLSSKLAPVATWGKVFEWVDSLTAADTVVCFNSSEFENEVLKALLVSKIPTVLVVMDHFRDTFNVQVEYALKESRLLILELQRDEPLGKGATPKLRNQYIINQVQHIACGYINPNGSIFGLLALSSSRLEAAAVVAGRLAEVLGAVAAEVGEGCEVHAVGYLRERQAFVVEVFFQDGHRGTVDETAYAVAGDTLDSGGEVLG